MRGGLPFSPDRLKAAIRCPLDNAAMAFAEDDRGFPTQWSALARAVYNVESNNTGRYLLRKFKIRLRSHYAVILGG